MIGRIECGNGYLYYEVLRDNKFFVITYPGTNHKTFHSAASDNDSRNGISPSYPYRTVLIRFKRRGDNNGRV